VKLPVSGPASGIKPVAPVDIDASVPCETCPESAAEPDVAPPVAPAPPEFPEAGVELAPVAPRDPLPELEVAPLDAPEDPEPDAPVDTAPGGALAEHAISAIVSAIVRRWKWRSLRTSG
jgi:hypothetical protein